MTNPFPFSSNAILTAAELNSIGEWTDYTPSTNSWSSAGSFDFVRYAEVNKIVFVKFKFTLTGTPTGVFQFSQPVVEVSGDSPAGAVGTAQLRDSSAGTGYVGFLFMSGDNIRIITSGLSNVLPTAPFTWASGDSLRGLMIYEAE
jgi:hypothetical protein